MTITGRFVGQVVNLFPMCAGRTEGRMKTGGDLTGSLCWEVRTGTRGRRRSGADEADNLLDLERSEVEGIVRRSLKAEPARESAFQN